MGFYDDDNDNDGVAQEERQLIGYCTYNKQEVYSDDDYIRDSHGRLYLRENYVQASLGLQGEIIDPNEEE